MSEYRCDILIYNGLETNSDKLDNSLFYAAISIYEVVRVIGGQPVFLEDHINRLENSTVASSRNMLMQKVKIRSAIYRLIKILSVNEGNIKVSFNYNEGHEYSLIYFIEALYPKDELYTTGIQAILFKAERFNPGIKIYNYLLRSQIYDKLVRTNAYEALLVNSDNCLTEGSKSNVFFIIKDIVVTAPDGEVLSGITRKYIIELCRKYGLKIEQRSLPLKELDKVDSVFISGTSPKILPVRSLGDHLFDVGNSHLRFLMTAYDNLLDSYLKSHSG